MCALKILATKHICIMFLSNNKKIQIISKFKMNALEMLAIKFFALFLFL